VFYYTFAFVDWTPSQVTSTFSPFDTTPVVSVTSYRGTVG